MYKTEQENFWAGEFGDSYLDRNNSEQIIAGNINLFSRIFSKTKNIKSVIEFGSNIGLNLRAIQSLKPNIDLSAIEINNSAVLELKKIKNIEIYNQSILEFKPDTTKNFVFSKGVLIHINPDKLPVVYELLYKTSNKYICIIEYYNPTPVSINYRGHKDRLFKRDFAGEMLEKYQDLELVDYGFSYHRDNNFPQDDLNWFLLKK